MNPQELKHILSSGLLSFPLTDFDEAGGFGHSRLREWMLGGTTDGLLEAMHLPVLFSH